MKEIIKPVHLRRIELWAATTVVVFSIFFLIIARVSAAELGYDYQMPFNYYSNYFFPQLLKYILFYGYFLLLNFVLLPRLVDKKKPLINFIIFFGLLLFLCVCIGILDIHMLQNLYFTYANKDSFYQFVFRGSLFKVANVTAMFLVYTAVKYGILYLLSHVTEIGAKYRAVIRDSFVAMILWMISIFTMVGMGVSGEFLLCWCILIPFAIACYCFSSYRLLPTAFTNSKPFRYYFLKSLLVQVFAYVPLFFLLLLVTNNENLTLGFSFFNTCFQLFLTAPLSWVLYKRRLQGNEEIIELKEELGRSNANLDFLRSQINPHFLFNALNTIYATALNENAEKTSEAIQKLGDMMRFMLHENTREKISLSREIEYLNNYIDLQKMRTAHNPSLAIKTDIEETVVPLQIAPMLLIPFVENAFKHGISFREPSQIRIALEIKNKIINFDVYNSKHARQENDPEEDKSGIGLENVKQRLLLLYPAQHDLIIRETKKEYFIHLTIHLNSIP